PWDRFIRDLWLLVPRHGRRVRTVNVRAQMRPWPQIEQLTEGAALRDDAVFATVPNIGLADLYRVAPHVDAHEGDDLVIVYGPGAAFVRHDVLWYADLPKRHALRWIEQRRAPNLGQPHDAVGTARRLVFIDWPIEDRHRRELVPRLDRYIDLTDVGFLYSLSGDALRSSLATLVTAPFRTRPAFTAQPWGGRWARDVLGVPESEPNTGLGYELVAPESGILLGDDKRIEVGLDVLLAEHADELLGESVARRFDRQFPIRFDYLDTVGGGDLSVHCHPRESYMREVFGFPYAQDESYYAMVTSPGSRIHLGLRGDADVDAFRAVAERSQADGRPFAVDAFVNVFPAEQHQLYLIPAGTPHGSGDGNVVLEISATPYLYSLRMYDWMRAGLDGAPRAVQLHHAFANLDPRRRGDAVLRELVPRATLVRSGEGFAEYAIGRHADLFFAVHRLDIDTVADDDTRDRFHVLNLVEGDEVMLRTRSGREHRLAYAETIVVPAAVGAYTVTRTGREAARVVKAFVA
ncbi:MAG: class I mannose-6-phosphate isomerase, partial [Candidatus Limnocylindria bacterium]